MTDSRTHNVLMIAYGFPPSAGGGVQRATKMARYLPEFGWRPYVLSATPVPGAPTDAALLEQVAGIEVRYLPNRHAAARIARIIGPLKRVARRIAASRRTSGGSRPVRASTGSPLSTRIARRLYLDSAEPWARSLDAEAKRWAAEVQFDAVIATGPPHSALVAGARIANALGVPYIVDERDAWTTNPGYRWADSATKDARSRALERSVAESADAVIAVSAPIADEATEAGARRTVVVPNGFDPADLPDWTPADGPLTVALMGNYYGATDATPFFDGAAAAVARGGSAKDLRIEVIGKASDFLRRAVRDRGLDEHVTYHGFLPQSAALAIVARADFGLVALTDYAGAEANYTGKLFEYLGIGIPVLLVAPERGVAATLVREASAGAIVPHGDVDGVADVLERAAAEKREGRRHYDLNESVVTRFERREQMAVIAALLDDVCGIDRSGAGPADATPGSVK